MTRAPRKQPSWPADAIERRALSALRPYPRNARTHTPEQVEQIAASMRKWGWTMPLLIDEADMIIAGHARTEAAKLLDITEAPVIVARGWSRDQIRAYVIADNKLATNSDWSQAILISEVGKLTASKFDVGLLGFSPAELTYLTEPDRPFDPERDWHNAQADPNAALAFRSLVVHFRNDTDVADFAHLIERPITPGLRLMWYPAEPAAEESAA